MQTEFMIALACLGLIVFAVAMAAVRRPGARSRAADGSDGGFVSSSSADSSCGDSGGGGCD